MARPKAVAYVPEVFEMRARRACRVIGVDRTSVHYEGDASR